MTSPTDPSSPRPQLGDLAREHVGVTVAAGLALGLVAGLMLPRPRLGGLSRKARAALSGIGQAVSDNVLPGSAPLAPETAEEPAQSTKVDRALRWLRLATGVLAAARGIGRAHPHE